MKKILLIVVMFMEALLVVAESRNALLIANGKYKSFSSLANPVPEAEGLKKSLIELGFDVTIVTNASKEQMETAILDFQKKLSVDKGIGFFHYGGHAVQVNGENYLIPADADIPDEPRVSSRAVNVSEIMASMQADTNIVILDSCRNNPLPSGSGRSASRGLQMVKNRPRNSVIVYSAEAGKTARDGVFTPILTKKILENKELIAVLRDVRNEVAKATNDEQTPGQYDQLKNEVFLAANVPSRLAKVEAENEELDKQLEALRAKKSAASNQEEQNRIAMEQQRIESEKKRKELELKQVREAEARRAADAKRIADENAKKNENQRLQDEQFTKMQADNAAKLKEIERLSAATNIDEMVASANALYQAINNITNNYTVSMNKAIDETKSFYQKKKDQIVKSKYESEAEFADRRRGEETVIDKQQDQDIVALQRQYYVEIINDTADLKRKLKAMEGQTEIQTGNNIKLSFGEYNADKRIFPATVIDTKNSLLKLDFPMEISYYKIIEETYTEMEARQKKVEKHPNRKAKEKKSKKNSPIEKKYEYITEYVEVPKTRTIQKTLDRAEFVQECINTENKIKSGGYVGFIEYALPFYKISNKYVKVAKTVGIKDVSNGKTIVKSDVFGKECAVVEREELRLSKVLKLLGDNNIAIGDVAYEGNMFSTKYIDVEKVTQYISDYKPYTPIGVVFAVSPRVMIIHITENEDDGDIEWSWYEATEYCKRLSENGRIWSIPDKGELNKIYLNREVINKTLTALKNVNVSVTLLSLNKSNGTDYWSSTYKMPMPDYYRGDDEMLVQSFYDGKNMSDLVYRKNRVRAVTGYLNKDDYAKNEDIKYLGNKNIKVGDIAYEGGKFSTKYIDGSKPIGIVFEVFPKVKVVYLKEEDEYKYIWSSTYSSHDWDDAIRYCNNLSADGGGWYMPDKDELNKIYSEKTQINNALWYLRKMYVTELDTFEFPHRYWSSSIVDKHDTRTVVWTQDFATGKQEKTHQERSYARAVKTYLTKDDYAKVEDIKYLGDENIKVGDIAYEGGKFSTKYIEGCLPIGIVFEVSPKIKIVHLKDGKNIPKYLKSGIKYCSELLEDGGNWYLPDIDELNKIYAERDKIDNALNLLSKIVVISMLREDINAEKLYWSSTPDDRYGGVKSMNFRDGVQSGAKRGDYFRAVKVLE